MRISDLTTSRSLRSRAWTVAPVLAVVAVIAAAPCDCPEHTAPHAAMRAQVPTTAMAGMAHASHGGMTSTPERGGAAAPNAVGRYERMTFEVGTSARPLVTRGASGPLWKTSKPGVPGQTKHGTFAEQTVARELTELREPSRAADGADEPVAARAAVLTTAQATKKLSKRCQQLIKRRKSSLRKADRKRREDCLAKRRRLVEASKPPATTPTSPTGVSAPAAPIAGPTPTSVPSPLTSGQPPAATTPTATTPAPREKKYAAAGVIATDGLDPFKLTRSSATADVVNFELDNTDRQQHDLYIAPASASGEVTGPLVKIIGRIDGGTRESADVELAPGRYKLLCTVDGHGPMAVNFTVYAP